MMRTKNFFIAILAGLFLIVSCKPKKLIETPDEGIDRSTALIWNSLSDSNIEYEWFYTKAASQAIFGDMTFGATADIRIKKDSVMLISLKKFGFELARAMARPDSVFGINRLEGSYFAMPVDSVSSAFDLPFDYYQIQELIVGNNIIKGQTPITSINTDKGLLFSTEGNEVRIDYLMQEDYRVDEIKFRDFSGRSFEVELKDPKSYDQNVTLPSERHYYYPNKEKKEMYLKIKMDKVEINKEKKIKFEIPSSYDKMW